ncbi:MAG: PQQ-dependent sugar dehydrogenase [Gemmatimonas sp.]
MNTRLLCLILLLSACRVASPQGPAQRSPTPPSNSAGVRAETVASGLVNPWALAFLPDGRLLVTERPGRLRIVAKDGALSDPVSGVPAVLAQGQGGLLDVAIDPQYAANQLVYLSYSEPGPDGTSGTSVARGRLVGNALEGVKVLYQQFPKVQSGGHYGSRLVFDRAGYLFITQGDRQRFPDSAQSLTAGLGKIMRIFPDGRIPPDNPFVSRAGARPEIWTLGHRNLQGATLDPATGRLWTMEHGARGGDELNHPEAGKNYGWPVITYGINYNGMKIGEGTAKDGMEQPVYYWDPVIAPSGMIYYTGDAIPGWKGSLLIGSMTPGALVRLEMRDGRVTKEERYLGDLKERIRDVQQGPDGFVYVVTDNAQGRVLRIRP